MIYVSSNSYCDPDIYTKIDIYGLTTVIPHQGNISTDAQVETQLSV